MWSKTAAKSVEIRRKLELHSIEEELTWGRLRYYGHLNCMNDEIWPKQVINFDISGSLPRGPPRMRWLYVIHNDLKTLHLTEEMAMNRMEWRQAIKPTKLQLCKSTTYSK